MSVLAIVYFVTTLLIKKYLFYDEINNKAIIVTLISTLAFCLFIYFLNRKKNTSKDNL